MYGETRPVRIVYMLPGPLGPSEAGRAEMERRLSILGSYTAPGTEVDIADVDKGPASIESLYEEYLSIPKTVKRMLEAEKEGYDAAVLGCYGDPGLSYGEKGWSVFGSIPWVGNTWTEVR